MAENFNRDPSGSVSEPYDYSVREYEACRMFSRFSDLHSYQLLLNNSCKRVQKTTKEIRFSPGFSFGTVYKSFIRRFGPPHDAFCQAEPFDHRILYYKFSLDGHAAGCELHFYKDRLFYFNYTLFDLDHDKKKEVLGLLCSKYLNGQVNMCSTRIVDRYNNMVFINDVLDLTVNYLSTRCELFTTLHPCDAEEMQNRCAERKIEMIPVL